MEWISSVQTAWGIIRKWNVQEIAKLLIVVVAIGTIWPICQSCLSVYDITLINRQNQTCDYALFNAGINEHRIKGSDYMEILPFHSVHIQVNPSWRGILGSYTKHLSVRRSDRKTSAVIPIYNSGDIKRSRTFFIEYDGTREQSSTVKDTWTWSDDHHFGQTNA